MIDPEIDIQAMSDQRFNRVVALLIALVTLAASVLTYLQSDASGRDNQANRDGMHYALEGFGKRVSGDARVNFDYNVAYQSYYEYDLLATAAANRGDKLAEARYKALRDKSLSFSPMLQDPYFKPSGQAPDVARYEVDLYIVEITRLMEQFSAASDVKQAWDYKANTYIIHITLLAVSLFFFGIAATIATRKTRWIFTLFGLTSALWGIGWAVTLYFQPVFDLREQGKAIDQYALGVGWAYREKYDEAMSAFDASLKDYPKYANALRERALVKMAQDKTADAIVDFEKAISAGDKNANTSGELAWAYYLLGDFAKSATANQAALKVAPEEGWIQFDLALTYLADGKLDEAKAEYERGMKMAADEVEKAQQENSAPPSFVWDGMLDASDSLDSLIAGLDAGADAPPAAKIVKKTEARDLAVKMMTQLKSLALALEYTGKPPVGELTAVVGPFTFAEPVYDAQGEVSDYNVSDTFTEGLKEFAVGFDYANMKDGSDVAFKLYIDGVEDPSWRILEKWQNGASGTAEVPVSYAYSDTFQFAPGNYTVEVYVDYHLAQQGSFVIEK